MDIKYQVVSLELSKRLKELGVKQESLWYWRLDEYANSFLELSPTISTDTMLARNKTGKNYQYFSAFTVAEIGEMLPDGHATWQFRFGKEHSNTGWHGRHIDNGDTFGFNRNTSPTEADARAKMLISLLENKLI